MIKIDPVPGKWCVNKEYIVTFYIVNTVTEYIVKLFLFEFTVGCKNRELQQLTIF